MSQKNNHIIYTAADIEKYHKGLMPAKESHALEKAALDDPFLADALEGYAIPSVNSNDDIVELKNRLTTRIEQNKKRPLSPLFTSSFSWWKVAAMIILIFGAGLLLYQFGFNNKRSEIAQANKKESINTGTKEENIATPDSLNTFRLDSHSTEAATQQSEKNAAFKKTEPLPGLVAPNGAAENSPAEPNAVKSEIAKEIVEAPIPQTTAAAKTDDKEDETKKSLRNDNAVDKNIAAEKSAGFKSPELSLKKKADADADGVSDRWDDKVVLRSARNSSIPTTRGFSQTNVFRGRVTDAHNNALPFSNITNLEDSVGTYSDARGYFNLTYPDSVLNVQVRSLGFESNNFQLRNNLTENKLLLEEDRSLSASILDTVKRNTNRLRNNNMVLEEPEPVDGWSNYDMYLVNNLKVPESFRAKQSGGEVELSFEVDKNGEPVNITVKKSLCQSCDREAIRLLKEGPKWKRKIKKRKAVVTISF